MSNFIPVALITGAAKRLGAMITKAIHQQGYNVVIHYHESHSDAEILCDSLNAIRPNSAITVKADIADLNQISCLVKAIEIKWTRLDVLIHNASTFFPTPMGSTLENHWHNLIDSNLKGAYFLSESCWPLLKTSKGNIITLSDIHGETPLKNYSIYSIAKAGLIMMTKTLAKEMAPEVRVNSIAPTVTLWPEKENQLEPKVQQDIIQKTALKKLVDPQDIFNAILFLIKQNSMTGHILKIDCGRTLVF